jgi:uncharacterized lipoprotein
VKFVQALLVVAVATASGGCARLLHGFAPDCHRPQEYQRAVQVAPLKVPAGLDTPNTQGALVIPTVELAPPPPTKHDSCMDEPPRYKPAPPNKAASSTSG